MVSNKLFRLFMIMVALVAADQGIKIWVRADIPLYRTTVLIPNLLELTHVENRGVSFSFLGNLSDFLRVPLLLAVSIMAILLLLHYWWRHAGLFRMFSHLAFVLILPGAVGNLIDRAAFGTVTDYLHFRYYDFSFFVNNLADIFISAGVISFMVGMIPARERPVRE